MVATIHNESTTTDPAAAKATVGSNIFYRSNILPKAPVTLSRFWATAELRLTPICQIGMHRHDS